MRKELNREQFQIVVLPAPFGKSCAGCFFPSFLHNLDSKKFPQCPLCLQEPRLLKHLSFKAGYHWAPPLPEVLSAKEALLLAGKLWDNFEVLLHSKRP